MLKPSIVGGCLFVKGEKFVGKDQKSSKYVVKFFASTRKPPHASGRQKHESDSRRKSRVLS